MINTVDKVLRYSIFGFYIAVVFLSFWAPFIQEIKSYPAGESIYKLFSPICHQYPTRCFWIFERPWALCARCASGYLGLAVAALLSKPSLPFWKRSSIGIFLVGIAAVDPVLQLLGFYESNNVLRLINGLIGGYGAFMIVYPIPFKHKEQVV
jgi:uncharacterized membrane protein